MISAISVKDRLKNQAAASGKTMQEALIAYGLERTVYRISISEYLDRLTLKGGIFLYVLFDGEFARVTRDIDLLANNLSNDVEGMRKVFGDIFSITCDDALRYDLSTMDVRAITEFKEYHGVNISIMAFLDKTRVPVSIDVGFGDVIYPERVLMDFPVLLDMDAPEIYAYSVYSVIAEKFEAIVSLGNANSRYKDFYDIFVLADKYTLDGRQLKEAVSETFEYRGTGFEDIVAFDDAFLKNEIHQSRWRSFIKKKKAIINVSLEEAIDMIKTLLIPVVISISEGASFSVVWDVEQHKWK